MSENGFDELSRALASPRSRRTALKAIGVSVGAAAGAVILKPFRADAVCAAGQTPCGAFCCSAGSACLNKSTGKCGCASGYTACGKGCCKGTCTDPTNSCCCEAGTTPCGSACCAKGAACYDAKQSLCGCAAGTTPCAQNNALTCAPKGKTCDGGPWPPPNTQVKNCVGCITFAQACTSDSDCCSGICSAPKGNLCGCASDADCPGPVPFCNPQNGICHD